MIVIAGASGNVGGLVAKALSERGLETRLVVRDAERAPALEGAEVAVASYEDGDALEATLEEGDRVFMVSIHAPNDVRVGLHSSFVEAARRRNVGHVVYLSFVNASPDAVFYHGRSHGITEQLIAGSGLPHTFVRTSMYMDNLARWFDEEGVCRGPGGSGRLSFSYRPDVAHVVASVLTEPGHDGKTYDATSREAVSLAELAAAASEATGATYRYEDQDRDEWVSEKGAAGWEAWELEGALSSWDALRAGEFDVTSDAMAQVGHVEPASVAGFVSDNVRQLPLVR